MTGGVGRWSRARLADAAGLCRRLGLGEGTVELINAGHRDTLVLWPQRIVLRVAAGPGGEMIAAREVAIGRWLATRSAPAAEPVERDAGPHRLGDDDVTLWRWVDHDRSAGDEDAVLAALTLARLHAALRGYPGPLPPYTDALDGVARLLADPATPLALSAADRAMLAARFAGLRAAVPRDAAVTPLHGDAHPGNLLLGQAGAVWADFEDACIGPPEYDIACLPPAAWPIFAIADQPLIARFAAMRGICVATWCAARDQEEAGVRAALAHHLAVARHR